MGFNPKHSEGVWGKTFSVPRRSCTHFWAWSYLNTGSWRWRFTHSGVRSWVPWITPALEPGFFSLFGRVARALTAPAPESSRPWHSYGRVVCLGSSRLHFICKAERRRGTVSGLKHIPPHITWSDNSSRSGAKHTAALSLKHNALSAPLNTVLCVMAGTEEEIKKMLLFISVYTTREVFQVASLHFSVHAEVFEVNSRQCSILITGLKNISPGCRSHGHAVLPEYIHPWYINPPKAFEESFSEVSFFLRITRWCLWTFFQHAEPLSDPAVLYRLFHA